MPTAPAQARAVVATAYGGPEVLQVVPIDPGPPGLGEVLLDVRAAAVNPWDWKSYSGTAGHDPARLPMRLGLEASGVVAEVGPGVRWLAPGDEVVAWPVSGAYASRVVVPEQSCVRRPASLGWAQAAGLLVTGVAAVHALAATGTGSGDVVLVHGGTGGVGRLLVQLAVLRGARVVATGSAASADDLRELGAVPVAYGDGLVERLHALEATVGPVTVAVDTVGTDEALDASVALVADRSRIATLAGFARGTELGILVLGSGRGADPGTQVREAARGQLVELAADGSIEVHVARTYPLEAAAEAHRDSRTGHARGKLVLLP
ncbi:NADP-dependent oxidoreductase [Cellulomonas soli]|uniref:NADP-dependent oxidoreductase n=1 Tax=Cellulomonas soli TaxID=931535 RepID=UPI0011BF58B8|nr:NADP-dependent oxidoreductase [Cellulomonas soli]NYI59468.1 NADPH:quinone reductase-like Zn-dependent oxidoreductase [Cellulomonas soli]